MRQVSDCEKFDSVRVSEFLDNFSRNTGKLSLEKRIQELDSGLRKPG